MIGHEYSNPGITGDGVATQRMPDSPASAMIEGRGSWHRATGIGRTLIRRAISWHVVQSLFWLMMLVVHTPAFLASWRDLLHPERFSESVGTFALYALALSFFTLKIINISFLRWRLSRRSCVAWCVVVALLHVDVVRPDAPSFIPECATFVAATCLVAGVLRIRRLASAASSWSTARCRFVRLPSSCNTLWQDTLRPHCWILVLGIRRLRAPPLCAH